MRNIKTYASDFQILIHKHKLIRGKQYLGELFPGGEPGLALVFKIAFGIEDDFGFFVRNNLGFPEELVVAERLADVGHEVERLARLDFERGDVELGLAVMDGRLV